MSKDDYQVIAYKILAYFYACLKEGIDGNVQKAQELTESNNVYFLAVLQDLLDSGYMSGSAAMDYACEINGNNLRVTLKGVEYLDTNSTMAKVKKTLGKAFELVLQAAVSATGLL